jgi:hypothetical protein
LNGWLGDHVLHGQVVVPGAALLELCCAAAMRSSVALRDESNREVCVEGFTILQPLIAEDVRGARTEARATRVWCVVGDDGSVGVYSDVDGDRTAHAEAAWR